MVSDPNDPPSSTPPLPGTAEELLPLVYGELRRLAASRMAQESPGMTIQATALVHEAWMRLEREQKGWENRAQFFAAAAEAMRCIASYTAGADAPSEKRLSWANLCGRRSDIRQR